MSARLRTATAQDIPELLALINEAYLVEADLIEGLRTSVEQLQSLMETAEFLVAEKTTTDEPPTIIGSVYWHARGARAYLGMLAVHPHYQGQGIAIQLIDAVKNSAKQQKVTFLDISVLSARPELFHFYQKQGFHPFDTEAFHAPALMKKPFILVKLCLCLSSLHQT